MIDRLINSERKPKADRERKKKKPTPRYRIAEPTAELTDQIITREIEPNSRVVDLGCGDGRLLVRLRDENGCSVAGVELGPDTMAEAIRRGVSIIQADLNGQLTEIPDNAFDYAVLSQTLQEIRHPKELLREMQRIAHRTIVVVPNFGHWRVRVEIGLMGRAPVTQSLPYNWFDTPNQRFMSLHDFRDLAQRLDCTILREVPIIRGRAHDHVWLPNLRADSAMYVLEANQRPAGPVRSAERRGDGSGG